MRKFFASAILCLLLLLSVGSVRCESRCVAMAMPKATSGAGMAMAADAPQADVEMAGMEHCAAMSHSSDSSLATVSRSHTVCSHESLPATADTAPVSAVWALAAVALPLTDTLLVVAVPAVPSKIPPLQRISPLEQSSMLRV